MSVRYSTGSASTYDRQYSTSPVYENSYERGYSASPATQSAYEGSGDYSRYYTSTYPDSTLGLKGVGPHGRDTCGFLSVRISQQPANLRNLQTWQTFNYESSQGREAWFRTYNQDQEWLRQLAGGAKAITEWDKPWIGAIVVTTDPRVVILKDCIRDGPADLAGLDDDDIIVGFGNASVSDNASFNRAYSQYAKVGVRVQVTYLKEGQGAPKTTFLEVKSQGHQRELIETHRRNGVSHTTDKRRGN